MEMADSLVIQSLHSFKERANLLLRLFNEIPQSLTEDRINFLIANELGPELLTLIISRQIKFNDLRIYNISCEYTDKLDSMLKQTRHLTIYKCNFR